MRAKKFKPISKEELYDLITKAQSGDPAAKDLLVERNLPLVLRLTSKFFWACTGVIDFDDLFQQGTIGLMRCLEKFDITKNFELSTYAAFWINQRIGRYIDDNRGAVRVPIYLQSLQKKYAKIKHEDEENPESHNDDFYLRLVTHDNETTVSNLRHSLTLKSSDIRMDDELETFQLESIVDENEMDVRRMDFEAVLAHLSLNERYIIRQRMTNWSFKKIAEDLNISRERVRQIEEGAILKMKAMINDVKKNRVFEMRDQIAIQHKIHKKELLMKVDSSKFGNPILAVCSKCADIALLLPENKSKFRLGVPNWIEAECDMCHKVTAVAPVRDFMYPVFEVKK